MRDDELCEAKILVIEDDPPQLRGNKRDIETIPEATLRELGIGSFVFHLAHDVEEAERFLSQAAGSPYDLVMLDLGLPIAGDGPRPVENGQRLLERIRQGGLAKEIIVISVFWEAAQVARAYRNGVVDFVAKPFETKELQTRFIRCWKQLLGKESARLLGEMRSDELVQYAEKGLAHRFTACFSGLVQSVVHNGEEIEQYIHERYDLDRLKDSQDPLFRLLKSQHDVVAKRQGEWAELRDSLISPNDSLRAENVESLFAQISRSVLPCTVVKNFKLNLLTEEKYEVSTFADDVGAVLKEIIVGGMREVPDYDFQRQEMEIRIQSADEQVRIIFADRLQPIDDEDAKVINQGMSLPPFRRFDRAWGLSVVQHVAMRGGGRLEIRPQPKGNVVTYYVPSAR